MVKPSVTQSANFQNACKLCFAAQTVDSLCQSKMHSALLPKKCNLQIPCLVLVKLSCSPDVDILPAQCWLRRVCVTSCLLTSTHFSMSCRYEEGADPDEQLEKLRDAWESAGFKASNALQLCAT